jgi:hypothetical protein
MTGGFFGGLRKIIDSGAEYLQHQQFLERLRGMQFEDAKHQLTTYVRGMPDATFNGLKVALGFLGRSSRDPIRRAMFEALLRSLDNTRTPPGVSLNAVAAAAPLGVTQPQSFAEDLTLVAAWYDLPISFPPCSSPDTHAGSLPGVLCARSANERPGSAGRPTARSQRR